MADYTHLNLKQDVEDLAPKHGLEGTSHALREIRSGWRRGASATTG